MSFCAIRRASATRPNSSNNPASTTRNESSISFRPDKHQLLMSLNKGARRYAVVDKRDAESARIDIQPLSEWIGVDIRL